MLYNSCGVPELYRERPALRREELHRATRAPARLNEHRADLQKHITNAWGAALRGGVHHNGAVCGEGSHNDSLRPVLHLELEPKRNTAAAHGDGADARIRIVSAAGQREWCCGS